MDVDILDHIPVAITEVKAIYGDDGELVDFEWIAANELMNRSILPDGGSIVGLRVLEFDPAYEKTEFWPVLLKALKEQTVQQIVTRQGRTASRLGAVVKTTITPKGDTCVVCSHEVTDIANQRDEAKRRFEYIKTACDHSAQGLVLTADDGEILYANEAVRELVEYTVEELEGKKIQSIVHPDEAESDIEMAAKLLSGEVQQDIRDKIYISKSGEEIQVSASVSIGWSPDRSAYIFIGHIRDVREKRRLEAEQQEIRKDLSILKRACDHAAEGIMLIDSDRITTYANAAMEKMFGYEPGEMIGLSVTEHVSPPDAEQDYQVSVDLFEGRIEQETREKTAIRKDGTEITVSVALSMMPLTEGEKPLFIAHVRDVTEARRTREALKDALKAAEGATRLKSEFLANMSHEIRTPLNGVLGMSQVLAHSGLTDEQAEHLSIIQESGNNLMVLLNDILDLSKIEAGKLDVSPIDADLRHKLNRVIKVHEAAANAKGLDLQFVVHPSVPAQLEFDPVRLRQCIDNILSNAIKFTETGQVIVAVTSVPTVGRKHKLTIHISDTGPGIPQDKQDAIFLAFQQMDGSITRSHGGTGLGLAITRQLAKLMGGNITLASEVGKGSVFTLTFEATARDAIRPDNPSIADLEFPETETGDRLSGKRALIVDDNGINRQVARVILKGHGMITGEAENGRVALEELHQNAYDIVLMDIHMPEMDGTRAIRKIRALDGPLAEIPVIALTADAMSGDREKYLSMGMTGYISKPINESDLVAEIASCLEQSPERLAG